MKKLFAMGMVAVVLFAGCAPNQWKSVADEERTRRTAIEARLDSLTAAAFDSLGVLAAQLAALDSRTTENENRFREYRKNLASYQMPAYISFCGQMVYFDTPDKRERLEREFNWFMNNQALLMQYYRRAGKYFSFLEEKLVQAGKPEDLKYVAVIESDLDPNAHSPVGADGPWQFMPGTASDYNLKTTTYVDERRHWEKSTEAATRMFDDLIGEFGDWFLAMAAYNAGPGRVKQAIAEQGVRSYFDLWLPKETERFDFRAFAVKLIFENPGQYGIPYEVESYWERIVPDTATFTVRSGLKVRKIADWSGTTYREIRLLNPHIRKDHLGSGKYTISLPADSREQFLDSLAVAQGKKK